jgi:predicted RNA-binding protein with PIN domain
MPYIIDGNNVMAGRAGFPRDWPTAKRRFLREVARFVAARRVKVRVVFDGYPDDEFPEGRKYKSVQVLYARPGSDADTRIKDLVEKASNRRDLIVVTSDRSLANHVSRRGARVITRMEFGEMVDEILSSDEDKPGDTDPVDVEEWLEYFAEKENGR